ncbi:putative tetratricopeptide-like helical domain superfamily [Helianthus annuus]|nr:putative tetratricopeptide-like helical domain superfamily [Helianthus annuus]
MLEDLTKIKPSDPEVFRLLGEVKLELKDYEGSIAAYRTSAEISNKMDIQVLRGLTNALLAAKKPDEACHVELLLGKAYSDWGHVSDAVSVYDRLISSHPNDLRGYLAKARFFSPEGAKAVVDRYSRQ